MKRLVSAFLAGAMALSLAACGGAASTSTVASSAASGSTAAMARVMIFSASARRLSTGFDFSCISAPPFEKSCRKTAAFSLSFDFTMPVLRTQAEFSEFQLLHAVERLLELVNADGAGDAEVVCAGLAERAARADEHVRALK